MKTSSTKRKASPQAAGAIRGDKLTGPSRGRRRQRRRAEYKTWKKNAPFLYDLILSTALEWPTLTTQWFPDKQEHEGKNFATHRLLIGTHTSGERQNFLQIAEVQLPKPTVDIDPRDYDETREEIGGYNGGDETRFTIKQKIVHEGEVNKARYSPQKPDLIATMSVSGAVYVFDRTKHELEGSKFKPQIQLTGHSKEGYGLDWSPRIDGCLLTGSEDTTICQWDLNGYSRANSTLRPTQTYTIHQAIVNDVRWHPIHQSLFGSASDDLTIKLTDTRTGDKSNCSVVAHNDAVNTLAFHPASEYIVASGSADKTVALWDLRNFKYKLHSLEGHQGDVLNLQWHPHEEPILASSSTDRRIIFWDLTKIGEEQTPEDQEDGPPELLFMHGGHTNRVSDFSWNLNDPWVMASAAEDNLLQVWKVAGTIVSRDDEEIAEEELQ
ncbi:histone acetyltransferase type B subunit 2 [Drechslerella stenobrocha 248]|uniref:Histone acetyltransferase type B subunit 2 n=1 Tax=Drechslerella stenobrocha 248 TaxID=1043628 RepID=W7HYJ9_9PEZI|nr:histone acetyltransferase type B subunit 2 [Drechslerella stenobrocha 248]